MIIPKIIKNVSKKLKKVVKKLNLYETNKNIENKLIKSKIENIENNYLFIPSSLIGFTNETTDTETLQSGKIKYCFKGNLEINVDDYICSKCGSKMHINNRFNVELKHLCFGNSLTCVCFERVQFYCSSCHNSNMQNIPFKNDKHRITNELYNYTRDLLATGHYTNTEVAELTGLNRNIVKEIDKERLLEKYTVDGKELIKPETQAKYLGIDEFKLHNGYKYATHIIDLETGHVLWIEEGKKKQIVYDFMNHVGREWMKNVIAVACDMNSDFEEAFIEKYPHINIVFDHFHVIKNYNEKVISNIRKEEQNRLEKEGKKDEAKTLKRSKYILTSKLSTLKKKDKEASSNKVISKGNILFNKPDVIRRGGNEEKYNKIMEENELLFKAELIREKLDYAYTLNDELEMKKEIDEIIEMCNLDGNQHLLWFSKLLKNHYNGIISHATHKISSGKIEGINNKIKTLRRQAYGYPDDEYFFLKIFDISRTK